jgi:phosphoenolpyruvate carboxykinase (GTP)
VDRCRGRADAEEAPLGWVPGPRSFDLSGMENFNADNLAEAQSFDVEEWRKEVIQSDELFLKLYPDLPKELIFQRELLVSRF